MPLVAVDGRCSSTGAGHASKWNKTTWFYSKEGLEFWLTFEPPTLHHLSLHAFHGRCYYLIYGHRRWPYSANWTLLNKVPTISFSHVSPLIWNYRLSPCHPWGLWWGVVTEGPRDCTWFSGADSGPYFDFSSLCFTSCGDWRGYRSLLLSYHGTPCSWLQHVHGSIGSW